MRLIISIISFFILSTNLYASDDFKNSVLVNLSKEFNACSIAFKNTGNEFFYKRCSKSVFDAFDEAIKLDRARKNYSTDDVWRNKNKALLDQKLACLKEAKTSQANQTIIQESSNCEYIYFMSLVSEI